MNKYAFLDRDGTLIFEPQDTYQIDSLDKLKILDGVIEGLKAIQTLGYRLVMISNQDGLGSPAFPQKDFEIPHKAMLKIFKKHHIKFDKILICPHFPKDNCRCRKPILGLVENFLEDIDLEQSFMCGNRECDEQFAVNLGVRFIPMQTNGSFQRVKECILKISKRR